MSLHRTLTRSLASLSVATLAVAAAGAWPSFADAPAEPVWDVAVPATFGSDVQNTNPGALFGSVSCASAGYCTAVGSFTNHDGNVEAFTQTSTGGVWATALPAAFGTDVQSPSPVAAFGSVSCASPGNCTAVGNFKDHDGNIQAFTQTSTSGVWATAVPATFGTDVQNAAPYASFDAVSCASPGNCTAVGRFKDHDGNTQAFTQTSTGGVWATALPAAFGTDVQYVSPGAQLASVSCASAGNCTAAGMFLDHDGYQQAFTQTSTGGVWATAVPATFGTDVQSATPHASFASVSCVAAGECTAAGMFLDHTGETEAFTQTSTGGVWATAVPTTFAAGIQNTTRYSMFRSVSCASAGNCSAVGMFLNVDGYFEAFTQMTTGGVWATAVPATFGADVQSVHPYATFRSVSCASAGNCTAVGNFVNYAGGFEAFIQTSVSGVWGTAFPASFGTDIQNTTPYGLFRSVSCAAAGNCTAAGSFANYAGDTEAFTQTSTKFQPPPPELPSTGSATTRVAQIAALLLVAGAALVTSRRWGLIGRRRTT